MFRKRLRNFISKFDLFQTEFDKTHSLTASQLAEKNKYKKIYRLRDVAEKTDKKK